MNMRAFVSIDKWFDCATDNRKAEVKNLVFGNHGQAIVTLKGNLEYFVCYNFPLYVLNENGYNMA